MPADRSPYYFAEVVRTQRLTPHMQRVTLAGRDLARFTSSGDPDERLLVVFPHAGEIHPPAPLRCDHGWDYPEGPDRPPMRSYTVRRWSPAEHEMDIDFVLHGGGHAATWARLAAPGHTVAVTDASGWYAPPADCRWQLLVGDLTALPAIGRIVENLPAGTVVHVIAEVPDPADRQRFLAGAQMTVEWLHGTGNGSTRSLLGDAVQARELPPGPGYLWFAGEAGTSRAVRRRIRHDLGWAAARYDVMGYWRADREAWTRRYERVRDRIEAARDEAIARGADFDAVRDAVDAAMEAAGL